MTTPSQTIQKEFILPVNRHGQITLPKALRKLFDVRSGESRMRLTVSDSTTATIKRQKTTEEVLAELDRLREEAIKKDPTLSDRIKHNTGKTVRELRKEFDDSLEGEAARYRYTPAYYYEQHPEEPRTPEIQAAIDKHNALLDYLAADDPAHADRLEEYRAL